VIYKSYFKSKNCKELYTSLNSSGKNCLKKIANFRNIDDNNHMNQEIFFVLTTTIPDQLHREIIVVDEIMAGLDPRNDLILVDPLVRAKHFHFFSKTDHDGIKFLSLRYLGVDGITKLNGIFLQNSKVYLLENNDYIKVGRIEIRISIKDIFPPPLRKVSSSKFNFKTELISPVSHAHVSKIEYLKKSAVSFNINSDINSAPNRSEIKKLQNPQLHKTFKNGLALIPFKFYAFLVNIVMSFFILAFLIPKFAFLEKVYELLFPISRFLEEIILKKYHELNLGHTLSLIEFFICYHFFMISSGLAFATTPGEFLIGLRSMRANSNFLLRRIKSYFYHLLNIVALPLILFDIPLYRARTLKEIITFTTKEILPSANFKLSRKIIIPLLTIAALLSPLALKAPFNTLAIKELDYIPSYVDVNTSNIISSSQYFGCSIETEINNNIKILPFLEKNKLGLSFYDLKSNNQLILREVNRRAHSMSLFRLRYANPLVSFNMPKNMMDQEILKNALVESFELKQDHFSTFKLTSSIFKTMHLNNLPPADSIFVNSFENKNPFVKISSGKRLNEGILLFFTPKETIEFKISLQGASRLTSLLPEIITTSFLSPARYYQATLNRPKDPQILEALEAFELGDDQTLLTYYNNEAKKSHANKDTANNNLWREYLIKNINQTKIALSNNKNIEKSLDDIIKSL